MTFYGTPATGAGWIVPKKYVEKVGDEGFKKAPVGAGPYRFVSFTPGVELVLEAYEQYWRKVPSVKRLVFKAIPDESTRLAALKRGEVDIVYSIRGRAGRGAAADARAHAEADADRWPRTGSLPRPVGPEVAVGTTGACAWPPTIAIDRQAINQAMTLGFSRITGSIIPQRFEFYWQPPAYAYDPRPGQAAPRRGRLPERLRRRRLLLRRRPTRTLERGGGQLPAGGGHPREAAAARARGVLQAATRTRSSRTSSTAASGAFGNAATRLETFVAAGGTYVYGSYPDIDGLFREQAAELDRKRREAMLHRIQQLMHEKAMYAPIWELGLHQRPGPAGGGVGARAHPRPRVLGALRGREAQGQVSEGEVRGPLEAGSATRRWRRVARVGPVSRRGRPRRPVATRDRSWHVHRQHCGSRRHARRS